MTTGCYETRFLLFTNTRRAGTLINARDSSCIKCPGFAREGCSRVEVTDTLTSIGRYFFFNLSTPLSELPQNLPRNLKPISSSQKTPSQKPLPYFFKKIGDSVVSHILRLPCMAFQINHRDGGAGGGGGGARAPSIFFQFQFIVLPVFDL